MSGAGELSLMDWIFGPRKGSETEIQLQTSRAVLRQLLHSSSQGRGVGSLISYLELVEASAAANADGYTIDRATFHAILDNAAASRDWILNLERALASLTQEPEIRVVEGGELSALVTAIVSENREVAALRKHSLAVDLGSFEGAIWADPVFLKDAVSELVTNAFKFSPEGSLVRLQAGFFSGQFEIRVMNFHDEPVRPGLPAAPIASGKEWTHPFLRLNNQIDDRYSRLKYGFGIGLTVCDYKMRQMNGKLMVGIERTSVPGNDSQLSRSLISAWIHFKAV